MDKELEHITMDPEEYKEFLEKLVKDNSPELFTNGGKSYASILMSVLLDNTRREARIYCKGLRPELLLEEPYWSSFKRYTENRSKKMLVLVESEEAVNEEPIQHLKKVREEGNHNVSVRVIHSSYREKFRKKFGRDNCNFAVYDDKMYRMEYDPEHFKAFGSFNNIAVSKQLIEAFDDAYSHAEKFLIGD